jgi:hypothetical protein
VRTRHCSRPAMDARAISTPRIRLGIRAESGPPRTGSAAGRARGLPAHKPNEYDTEHSRRDACDSQRRLRAFQRTRRQPFCGTGKSSEQQSFDDEHESNRSDELGHLCLAGAVMAKVRRYLAGGAVLDGAPPSRGLPDGSTKKRLPDGSTKKRKNSESGLSSMRVSFERRPAS